MKCLDCPATVTRGERCKPCAAHHRWERLGKHSECRPVDAVLCRCEVPVIDGDESYCIGCGHLIEITEVEIVEAALFVLPSLVAA